MARPRPRPPRQSHWVPRIYGIYVPMGRCFSQNIEGFFCYLTTIQSATYLYHYVNVTVCMYLLIYIYIYMYDIYIYNQQYVDEFWVCLKVAYTPDWLLKREHSFIHFLWGWDFAWFARKYTNNLAKPKSMKLNILPLLHGLVFGVHILSGCKVGSQVMLVG